MLERLTFQNIKEAFIITLIVLVPFAVTNDFNTSIGSHAKLNLMQLVMTVLMGFLLYEIIFLGNRLGKSVILLPYVLLTAYYLFSSLFISANRQVDSKETFKTLMFMSVFLVVFNESRNEAFLKKFVHALLGTAFLVVLLGFVQYVGPDFIANPLVNAGVLASRDYCIATFGNTSFYSPYLVLFLPVAVSVFFTVKSALPRIALGLLSALLFANLIFTTTRAAWMAVIVTFPVFAYFLNKHVIRIKAKFFYAILIALIVISLALVFVFREKLHNYLDEFNSTFRVTKSYTSLQRFYIWQSTMRQIKDTYMFGTGMGSWLNSFQNNVIPEYFGQFKDPSLMPQHAHNEYLELLSDIGIAGLGIFLWLVFTFLKVAYTGLKNEEDVFRRALIIGFSVGIVNVIIDNFFCVNFRFSTTSLFFWAAFAIVASVSGRFVVSASETGLLERYADRREYAIMSVKNYFLYGYLILALLLFIIPKPFISDAYTQKGFTLADRKETDDAIKALLYGYELEPTHANINFKLGYLYSSHKGDPQRALEYFEHLRKFSPNYPTLLYTIGTLHYNDTGRKGRLATAFRYIKEEVNRDPYYDLARINLGNIFLDMGKYGKALEEYNEAVEINPRLPLGYVNLSVVYGKMNLKDKQEESAKMAIEADTNYAHAYYNLGIFYKEEKRNFEALDMFRTALDRDTSNANYYKAIAEIYLSQNDIGTAKAVYLDAINRKVADPMLYSNMAKIYYQERNYEKSEYFFKEAIRIDQKNVVLLHDIGVLYMNTGRMEEAAKYFRQALELQPKNQQFINDLKKAEMYSKGKTAGQEKTVTVNLQELYNQGVALEDQQKYDEAMDVFRRIVSFKPDFAQAIFKMGNVYNAKNEYEKAIEQYKQAIKYDPNYIDAYINLGVNYYKIKNVQMARDAWKKALSIDPDNKNPNTERARRYLEAVGE